ncbi:MAG TPA: superoxide dismutase family protein, partial [Methylomirabilota bacterium]|nr:superoxide dismutase family protein [Methylomirabilota bacterium]
FREEEALMNIKILVSTVGLGLLFATVGVAQEPLRAYAELKDRDGKTVGMATFREASGGVIVGVEVKGLTSGLHAVHVHAVGKCEGPAFTSAGGHFNPAQKKHGLRSPEGPHAGDMPNMYVDKDGAGRFEVLTDNITLKAGDRSVFDSDGSALVIHAGADDDMTDPTGNAGDRAACGVITAGQPKK